MSDTNIFSKIKEGVQQDLNKFADKQIEKLVDEFRCELEKSKAEIVGKLINQIEICTAQDTMGHINFQINIRSDIR